MAYKSLWVVGGPGVVSEIKDTDCIFGKVMMQEYIAVAWGHEGGKDNSMSGPLMNRKI